MFSLATRLPLCLTFNYKHYHEDYANLAWESASNLPPCPKPMALSHSNCRPWRENVPRTFLPKTRYVRS
jgi:hypothetical protein